MGQFYRGVPLIKVSIKRELTVSEFEAIFKEIFFVAVLIYVMMT